MRCYAQAILDSGIPQDNHVVVSGIGCSGRVAGYMKIDSYHTTHGRAIPFAVGLKLANPELTVTVFSGEGDLAAIGGNHLIHAARRNVDISIICANNFNYGMTGGQLSLDAFWGSYHNLTLRKPRIAVQLSLPAGCFGGKFRSPLDHNSRTSA